MNIKHDAKGITLIELLIVIVIVGILATIAVPIYRGYMQRARRADAKTSLEQVRAAQEMRRAEYGSYSTSIASLQTSWGGPGSRVGDYDISFTVATATSFTAQAHPWTSRQTSDGNLSINNQGTKTPADKWAR
jgi:type IV pilus assembly protein PilE